MSEDYAYAASSTISDKLSTTLDVLLCREFAWQTMLSQIRVASRTSPFKAAIMGTMHAVLAL